MRILFVIGRLGDGGAERQLVQLAAGLAARGHEVEVVTLLPGGRHWRALEEAPGVAVQVLGSRLLAVPRLRRLLAASQPDAAYSFLYPANLVARLAVGAGPPPLVWGVRASHRRLGLWLGLVFRLSCRLGSRVPLLIANSRAGLEDHLRRGYRAQAAEVVPNGIDAEHFRRDEEAGRALRQEWGVGPEANLVGLVARLHPMKDHPTFLRVAARVAEAVPEARFVCVGGGPAGYRARLERLAGDLGLGERLVWAGARQGMPAVWSALDLAVLSSASGEGFSNAVAEAMASEVPVAATDVGDTAALVGGLAPVVPAGDPEALAEAVCALLAEEPGARRRRTAAGRQRIVERFSPEAAVLATEALLEQVIASLRS